MAKKPQSSPAKIDEKPAKKGTAKRVAVIRDKFKKAMDDPDFRARMAQHMRELLRQGRDD